MSHDPCERIRAEADTSVPMTNSRKASRIKQEMKQNSPESAGECKEEPPDFIETNCHWKDCTMEFPTQEDLVKVSIDDARFCSRLHGYTSFMTVVFSCPLLSAY